MIGENVEDLMNKKFIFDVDGTLTPSRQEIDPDFEKYMIEFSNENDVYLVTGSNREKTIEQIGDTLFHAAKRVYNCSGSDVYEGDLNVYRDEWDVPEDVEEFLMDELHHSKFPIRTGTHVEKRPGGINFSILGRGQGVVLEERDEYVKWDRTHHERKNMAIKIKNRFPDLEVQVGGQTGLDISPLGRNKGQILRDFSKEDFIYFYGDMMDEGQNDFPLADAIRKKELGFTYHVHSFQHTWDILSLTKSR